MLRAIITDDEAPARRDLSYLLNKSGVAQIVGEARTARETIILLESMPADVLFLDIKMPGIDGLQLAESLKESKKPPVIVFVTAYSEYALDAFGVNAFDYLMKPIDPARLSDTLNKVSEVIAKSNGSTKDGHKRIAVTKGRSKKLIKLEDIVYVHAKDHYCYLHTFDEYYLLPDSLTSIEAELDSALFHRVSRAHIVNINWVSEFETTPQQTLELTMGDSAQTKIKVSRRRAAPFKQALEV